MRTKSQTVILSLQRLELSYALVLLVDSGMPKHGVLFSFASPLADSVAHC